MTNLLIILLCVFVVGDADVRAYFAISPALFATRSLQVLCYMPLCQGVNYF